MLMSSLAVLMLLVACGKKYDPEREPGMKVAYPDHSDKDVEVPKQLVSEVESNFLDEFHKFKPTTALTDVEILTSVARNFLSFDVYALPRANKLAFKTPYHFSFPRGGGVIDLSKIVTGTSGSFKIVIRLHKEDQGLKDEDLDELNVYFVSNSKRRQIDGEIHGSGCGIYMKLTQFYHNTLSNQGLVLNATDSRYVSVISGSFFFFLIKEGVLHLGSISFENSKVPGLQCP